ncbi:CHAT domain-containing protein [Microcoleus sp. T2B6]|uniref:CHAT domain-containing tetratricopeptide repeat protein n=1 Tax=Microcoleus sp. T2B6 TaxID=3055424 RepID=UPI002FD76171
MNAKELDEQRQQAYFDFLMKLLLVAAQSEGNQTLFYPLLLENIELLNEEFALYLRLKVNDFYKEYEFQQCLTLAAILTLVAEAIQKFPQGSQANNLEIAIAGYEAALPILSHHENQLIWAAAQNHLATAYLNRIRGSRAFNIERAIQSYQNTLQVHTRMNLPAEWAGIQMNLGNAYSNRIEGSRADNIEQCIEYYKAALVVYSPEAFPVQCADIQNNLGVAYKERIYGNVSDNIEQAIQCDRAALQIFTYEAFPEQWARVSGNLAITYQERSQGEFADNIERSIAILQSILQVNTREAFPYKWANTQVNLGAAYFRRIQGKQAHNIELAITCYEAALQVLTKQESPQLWAGIQNNLGVAYSQRIKGEKADNLEQAIHCYKAALEIRTVSELPIDWAETEDNLGSAYLRRIRGDRADNLEQAIQHYQAVLQVRNHQELPQLWAQTQNNLGNAYLDRIRGDRADNIDRAITCYQSALQVYSREETPQSWADTQMNLGNAYCDRILGELATNIERGIQCYQGALLVYTRETHPLNWAKIQQNLSNAYRDRNPGDRGENLEQAIGYSQAALQVYTQESDPYNWANAQLLLGNAYAERVKGVRDENLKAAIERYQKALQVNTREALPENWAMTANDLGRAYEKLGETEKAIAHFKLALEIYTPTAFPRDCLRVGRNLGDSAFKTQQWAKAIEGYSRAIEAVETSRSWIVSEQRRQEILESAFHVYANTIEACVNERQLDKAIECVERSRSQRLVDLMASNDIYSTESISPEIQTYLQQYDSLQQQIDSYRYPQLSKSQQEFTTIKISTRSRAVLAATNESIARLEAQKQQVWEQLRSLDPVLAGEIKVATPNLADIQKLIDYQTTAILSFYTTQENTHIFVIKKDQISCHTCLKKEVNLQNLVLNNWLIPYVQNKGYWEKSLPATLSELANRLDIETLVDDRLSGIEELIVIPYLYLHSIPFSALPVGNGQYLGDRFLIRYAPSCQILEFCQKRSQTGIQLRYGTVEDATDDLPCVSFECSQLAQIYSIPEERRLRGSSQATVSNYRRLVEQVSGLHSSHHAQSRFDNPLESKLFLADGAITLGQLLTPAWRLPNLEDVFLSCCETGLGLTQITDDVLTLSTGFLCAGARSVISTLWAVEDLATALFSIFYHQHRQQGKSRIVSLQQAQEKLRLLSGQALAEYEPQLIPLLESKFIAAEKARKAAKESRDREVKGSEAYINWYDEYKQHQKVAERLRNTKKQFKGAIEKSLPFSHPLYWAAFTCSGLR